MADLKAALQNFADELAKKLDSFVADISALKVRTYTTGSTDIKILMDEDLQTLASENKLTLRAYTQIGFDGDTTICLPTDANGEVDRSVWGIHQAMVAQAIENRNAMLRTIGDAAASALAAVQKSKE